MHPYIKSIILVVSCLFFFQCSEKELEYKPTRGIVKLVLDNQTHYFTNIRLGYLTANGFNFMDDTVSHTHKGFSIAVAHYIPLDSIKVGHQYPMSYQSRFSSGILFRPTAYELWSSTNDYWTNELAGFIEVLAWDGKTMEANIDFWATNISSIPKPETTKYREKHITGYFKIRVR